ncbi:MAG: arylsulfatase [Methylobacter sp.]|uniref:arylsulfatase n=1 Tax=Methylobacter sp. TaxID=2051955 RepID=UPI00272FD50D|nr:arylsulfatase [Methylobacter sp.]MDP1667340.1 arylsulfatase [Methylobacter sp.]
MKSKILAVLMTAALCCICIPSQAAQEQPSGTSNTLDRSTLPIKEPSYPAITELDARNAKAPARFELKPPEKAPNIVMILIDDMGFGQSSAFGGPIKMPTVEQLAANGLKYNRFHTTALCSPTRTALLTGYNHHSNNAGAIMELATAFPGNTGIRPQTITPIAKVLRMNGYSTAAFGKYHETPAWEGSVSGPFDRWPTGSGFDKFYGFIGGETNQWHPLVYDGTTRVNLDLNNPNYHFTTDMTNQAIAWMNTQQSLTPDKPFFLYFATGATHAPHHAPKEFSDKYKGKFAQGWDKLREETLAKQKQLGVVPQNTLLAPKPADIKDWDKLTADEKRLFQRQMEVFAGFGEHTDHEIGRLITALQDRGELDNTLVFYIVGDNGASAEGGMIGMFNESTYFNGVPETLEMQLKKINALGTEHTYNHFAAGWAVAGNAPFTWTKQVASNFGGTRNGMVVHWPAGIKTKNEVRSQFHHVVDIAPTIYQAVGIPAPQSVDGIAQKPLEGVSMNYSFDNAGAPDTHKTQYFEMAGNRALYHDGWFAGTIHKAPWEAKPRHPLTEDVWELYNVNEDFSQANNLADKNPEKLAELQKLFMEEAVKYNVLPIDDRTLERFDAAIAGRPDLMSGRTSLTLYEGAKGIPENAFINVKNTSLAITADVDVPANGSGVLICQGGDFGGWSFYMKDGKPSYTYNWLGLEQFSVAAKQKVSAGKHTLKLDFAYDGGRGAGGTASIYLDGAKVGEGKIGKTASNVFGIDETADVGEDQNTPVNTAYKGKSKFTGKIEKVTVETFPFKKEQAPGKCCRSLSAMATAD